MKKSRVLVMVLSLILVFAVSLSGLTAKKKVIRIGNIQNPDQAISLACVRFAELVKEKTKGSIEVKVLPNSQLGDALTQIQSVKMGTLEAFIDGVGWLGQLVSDYYLLATPFAMKDIEQCVTVMKSEVGAEIAEKMRKQHGLRVVNQTDWHRLPRHILSKKPIYTVDDLKGIKLRVAEVVINIEAWKAQGVSPTPIAFSETYLALQQGVADAMECPLDMIYTQKFHEVAKYITLTGHQPELCGLIMNEKYFQKLTRAEQKAIIEAAAEAGQFNNQILYSMQGEFMEKMKKEGVTFITVNPQEFVEKGKNVPPTLEERGIWSKGLYEKVLKVLQ